VLIEKKKKKIDTFLVSTSL